MLPSKFREGQKEYFGKNGMTLHVDVIFFLDSNGDLQKNVLKCTFFCKSPLHQFAHHKQGQGFHVQHPVSLFLTAMIRDDDNLHILQIMKHNEVTVELGLTHLIGQMM